MAENPTPSGEAQGQIFIDDTQAMTCYANFCRVSSTPEEIILDLGLNPNPPGGAPQQTVKVSQRVVMNHFTGKRLVAALVMALRRHEEAFGEIEVDVRKRLIQQSQG